MAQLELVWWWISLVRLNILEVLLLHGGKSLVLKKHIIHKLMPLDRTVRVRVNLHEKLVELLGSHVLANNLSECLDKLINLEGSSLVRISNIESLSQLHDMLEINPLRGILLPVKRFFNPTNGSCNKSPHPPSPIASRR